MDRCGMNKCIKFIIPKNNLSCWTSAGGFSDAMDFLLVNLHFLCTKDGAIKDEHCAPDLSFLAIKYTAILCHASHQI